MESAKTVSSDASPFNSSSDDGTSSSSSISIGEKYNMNHKKRGRAIIFNHLKFKGKPELTRTGTNVDRDELEAVLELLGFKVEKHNDYTYQQLMDALDEASGDKTNKDADCLFVAVLTHGQPDGSLLAWDNMSYKLENVVWEKFSGTNCPALAGKPKLFLIQACMGDSRNSAVQVSEKSDFVPDSKSIGFTLPSQSDFLIAYSTVPGYSAWRSELCGTFFIQAFCKVVRKHWPTTDYAKMLTRVNCELSTNYSVGDGSRQSACFLSNLTRDIYFSPKNEAGQSSGWCMVL